MKSGVCKSAYRFRTSSYRSWYRSPRTRLRLPEPERRGLRARHPEQPQQLLGRVRRRRQLPHQRVLAIEQRLRRWQLGQLAEHEQQVVALGQARRQLVEHRSGCPPRPGPRSAPARASPGPPASARTRTTGTTTPPPGPAVPRATPQSCRPSASPPSRPRSARATPARRRHPPRACPGPHAAAPAPGAPPRAACRHRAVPSGPAGSAGRRRRPWISWCVPSVSYAALLR
jgi:hypothetical protein